MLTPKNNKIDTPKNNLSTMKNLTINTSFEEPKVKPPLTPRK